LEELRAKVDGPFLDLCTVFEIVVLAVPVHEGEGEEIGRGLLGGRQTLIRHI
jgi:hypothetical protein